MKWFLPASALLVASLGLSACRDAGSRDTVQAPERPATTTTTTPARGEVVWPQLRTLDDLAHRAAAQAKANRFTDLRSMAPLTAEALEAVASGDLPANARNRPMVDTLRADLRPLAAQFRRADSLSDAELKAAADQMFIIVHKIMESANVPHKHDPDHGKSAPPASNPVTESKTSAADDQEHDHSNCDHEHDHSNCDHEHDHSNCDHEH